MSEFVAEYVTCAHLQLVHLQKLQALQQARPKLLYLMQVSSHKHRAEIL